LARHGYSAWWPGMGGSIVGTLPPTGKGKALAWASYWDNMIWALPWIVEGVIGGISGSKTAGGSGFFLLLPGVIAWGSGPARGLPRCGPPTRRAEEKG